MTPRRVGNYLICDEIGAGGMARVFVGRARGDFGFARTVAIKTIHDSFAVDPQFVSIFVDEARLASRVHHPNVVGIIDVIAEGGSVFLVLDYVHGVTLAHIMARAAEQRVRIPIAVTAAVVRDLLRGLHAAHEAAAEDGTHLGIVHRDVSPQNVIVGVDGSVRLFDFGVAKAVGRLQTTRDGAVKGKLRYMAPEQLKSGPIDRRADIFAAAVVLWELLAGRRLFSEESEGQVLAKILCGDFDAPSTMRDDIPPSLDALVMRGLERQRDKRFDTAAEMAAAIDRAVECADAETVSAVVKSLGAEMLDQRAALVARAEQCALSEEPTVSAATEGAVVPRAGEGFPRRRFAAGALGVTAIAAALIAGIRMGRAPISASQSEPSVRVTTPPPAPSVEGPSAAALVRTEPAPVVSAASRPSRGTRAPTPLRKASPPAPHAPPQLHPCTASVVDDAGIRRYNRDCMQ